ncbi:MAG: poly(3-hydroxyalkanoate) depolymerase [Phycicoccus sp.]|nr:poly(3-hydroxyalkanoate) depolymerase [Phycicoccus sp.]
MHHKVVRVWGLDIRVNIRPGTEPGLPLLVCNGIGASLELLQPFVDTVDPRIEVIRFDIPGVGGSPTPPVPYTYAMMAALVDHLMTRLGHDRYDVLGISWGGGLAQQLAFQHRRRCRRVVLVATATGGLMVPAHPRVLSKMLTPRRYRDPGYARAIAGTIYGGTLRTHPSRVRELLMEPERLGSTRGYVFQLLAGVGWSSLPALPLIRQPVLILAGVDDPLIPLINARVMAALLPHAQLHVYDDGHLGLVTLADDLGPRVSDFLLALDLAG